MFCLCFVFLTIKQIYAILSGKNVFTTHSHSVLTIAASHKHNTNDLAGCFSLINTTCSLSSTYLHVDYQQFNLFLSIGEVHINSLDYLFVQDNCREICSVVLGCNNTFSNSDGGSTCVYSRDCNFTNIILTTGSVMSCGYISAEEIVGCSFHNVTIDARWKHQKGGVHWSLMRDSAVCNGSEGIYGAIVDGVSNEGKAQYCFVCMNNSFLHSEREKGVDGRRGRYSGMGGSGSGVFVSVEFSSRFEVEEEGGDAISYHFIHCLFVGCSESEGEGGGALSVEGDVSIVEVLKCTFVNCSSYSDYGDSYGGAIYCDSSSCSISHSSFTDCSSYSYYDDSYGGGIYCYSHTCSVSNCSFTNCSCFSDYSTSYGGAIYSDSSTCIISNSHFKGCLCYSSDYYSYGGGIYCTSSCNVTNCLFTNCSTNSSYSCGGGIYCNSSYSTCIISNSNLTDCFSNSSGGGIYSSSSCTVSECSFTHCYTQSSYSSSGGALYCNSSSSCVITRCTLTECFTSSFYGCYGGGIYCSSSCNISDCSLTNCSTNSSSSSSSYGGGIWRRHLL